MDLFLASLIIATLALLSSSRLAYRLRRSRVSTILFSGGWLPLLAGVILQISLGDAASGGSLLDLRPLIMTALGWIGMMVGLQARRDVLRSLPANVWRLSVTDALLTILLFGGFSLVMLALWSGRWSAEAMHRLIEPAAMLAACGIGWSLETRSIGRERDAVDSRTISTIRASGSLGVIFAIGLFGFFELFAGLSEYGRWTVDFPGMARMLVTTLALAVSMGFVGRYGLRMAGKNRAEQLVVFLGLVAFIAGIASRVGITPLFASMLTGIVIANLSGNDLRPFERFIFKAEPIVGAFFALLAGMLMSVSVDLIEIGIAMGLVSVRLLIKPLVWSALGTAGDDEKRGWAMLAPIRQGRLAIALGVSLYLVLPSEFTASLITVIVMVGIACDFITLGFVRFTERPGDQRLHPSEAAR